jgi:regulator of protease activity HflC (stomatin/prohibitin superfamily)
MIPALLVLVVAAVVLGRCVLVVPNGHAYVVERLGRYRATLGAGFHCLVPFLDMVRARHRLDEQTSDLAADAVVTSDNIVLRVSGSLRWKIVDAERASYAVADCGSAVRMLAITDLAREIGKEPLASLLPERSVLESRVVRQIQEGASAWGVEICGCEIRELQPPQDVVDAIAAEAARARASRERREP